MIIKKIQFLLNFNSWLDGQDVNTIDPAEDNDIRHTIHSASLRESNQTLSQRNIYQDEIPLNDYSMLQTPTLGNQMSTSSNQSLYETPNQSEIHLEQITRISKNHKAIQTSNMTLNKIPNKYVKKDKATQANSVPINRSHSLYKNKHFMIKRTPNLPRKLPQASHPNLIRKASQGPDNFEEDSFYNILNRTTNI